MSSTKVDVTQVDLPGTSTDLLSGDASTAITIGTGLGLIGTTLEVTSAPTGITANGHKILRQLIHLANQGPYEGFASGAYQETLPAAAVFPTSFIWWESAAKIKKIVEETVTYNPTGTIATDEWKVYDTDGVTVLATVTDAITYSGVFELSRTRTIV